MKPPILGIDLGTSNSSVAYCDAQGEVHLVPQRGGISVMPSIYARDDKGNELMGQEAKRQWQLNPKNTVYGFKRLLGAGYGSKVATKMRESVAYEVVSAADGEGVAIKVADETLAVAEVCARILARLRDTAADHLAVPMEEAVLALPVSFTDAQRVAVEGVAAAAGLRIAGFISEPHAALLAQSLEASEGRVVAVYDFGGGTFDFSILRASGGAFETVASGGDLFLGGIDLDNALIAYVLAEFEAQQGIDLSQDLVAMQRVRDMAERIKMELSTKSEVPFNIPFVTMTDDGQPLDIEMVVQRDEFEMLTEHLVDQTIDVAVSVLDEAGLGPEAIDEILLVGGQSQMPLVHQRIEAIFGRPGRMGDAPDEAVARGAARFGQGASAAPLESIPEASDAVVQSRIGIERPDGSVHAIVTPQDPLPLRKTLTFTTHESDQEDLMMRIHQGDSVQANDDSLLGELVLDGLQGGPAGSPRIEVIFEVDTERRLKVGAKDLGTGRSVERAFELG